MFIDIMKYMYVQSKTGTRNETLSDENSTLPKKKNTSHFSAYDKPLK